LTISVVTSRWQADPDVQKDFKEHFVERI
jgi:hypothetical protein